MMKRVVISDRSSSSILSILINHQSSPIISIITDYGLWMLQSQTRNRHAHTQHNQIVTHPHRTAPLLLLFNAVTVLGHFGVAVAVAAITNPPAPSAHAACEDTCRETSDPKSTKVLFEVKRICGTITSPSHHHHHHFLCKKSWSQSF